MGLRESEGSYLTAFARWHRYLLSHISGLRQVRTCNEGNRKMTTPNTRGLICRKLREIEEWFQWTTVEDHKWRVKWSRDRWRKRVLLVTKRVCFYYCCYLLLFLIYCSRPIEHETSSLLADNNAEGFGLPLQFLVNITIASWKVIAVMPHSSFYWTSWCRLTYTRYRLGGWVGGNNWEGPDHQTKPNTVIDGDCVRS